VGLAYGPVSGFVGIDIDGPAGEELLAEKSGGDVPETLEFRTGGGRRRLLYGIPEGAKLRTTYETPEPGQELRFQSQGAQTVAPPSRHPNGGRYVWREGHAPGAIELAMAPAWLVKELETKAAAGTRRAVKLAKEEMIPDGARDATLTSLAGTMRRRGMSQGAIEAALLEENASRCDPPLEESQVKKIARSVAGYPPGPNLSVNGQISTENNGAEVVDRHLTDLGNAQRVVARHGKDLQYCHPWKTWLIWDGRRWRSDDMAEAVQRVKETLTSLYAWTASKIKDLRPAGDDEERKAQTVSLTKLLGHCITNVKMPGESRLVFKWPRPNQVSRSCPGNSTPIPSF
jgi:putative DNA primase/helicase